MKFSVRGCAQRAIRFEERYKHERSRQFVHRCTETEDRLSRAVSGHRNVDKIIKNWRKAADISAVAGLCAGANKELSRKEKKEFYSGLPFGRTVFCKLARIGSDPRLHQEGIDKLLPANYSMQYEITKLTDEELQAAID